MSRNDAVTFCQFGFQVGVAKLRYNMGLICAKYGLVEALMHQQEQRTGRVLNDVVDLRAEPAMVEDNGYLRMHDALRADSGLLFVTNEQQLGVTDDIDCISVAASTMSRATFRKCSQKHNAAECARGRCSSKHGKRGASLIRLTEVDEEAKRKGASKALELFDHVSEAASVADARSVRSFMPLVQPYCSPSATATCAVKRTPSPARTYIVQVPLLSNSASVVANIKASSMRCNAGTGANVDELASQLSDRLRKRKHVDDIDESDAVLPPKRPKLRHCEESLQQWTKFLRARHRRGVCCRKDVRSTKTCK